MKSQLPPAKEAFPAPKPDSGESLLQQIAVKAGLCLLGAGAVFGWMQWQQQQQQLESLTQMVTQMQTQDISQIASRNASLDLLAVDPVNTAAAQPADPVVATAAPVAMAPAPAPVPVAVALPEPVSTAVHGADHDFASDPLPGQPGAAPGNAADMIRAMTAAAAAAPAMDPDAARSARKLGTLAIIDAGVQEIVNAVVAGNYEIHTNYTDNDFSGRIHFAFVGEQKDQTELEQFLAAAAEDGIVAFSSSVVDSNGRVNGHILLFDLVMRALDNGTPAERAASEKLRNEAQQMLAAENAVNAPVDATGDRIYVVEPGDSLAYIALQFYGSTNEFPRIFEANRDKLRSPERINVGQKLVIPEA